MQAVKTVAILGGGSAGWLTALVLHTYCPFLKIRLVSPRAIPAIGVGESTQSDFMQLLNAAHIDVQDFYRSCDATMKCGIFYEDWNRVGTHYWHPFSDLAFTGSYTAAHYYQQQIMNGVPGFSHADYYGAVHTSYATCVTQKKVAPESAAAFHVDARKITEYLQRVLERVEVVETDKVDVKSSGGRISGIAVDNGNIQADLYIDCTGFARALFKQVGSVDAIPYEANVNRAVTAQLPYVDKAAEVAPYTRAHAHEHGWTWTIPLQTRIGSGFVFHGDFCTPEQAETNFRRYWGEARMHDIEVRHFSFDSTCLRNPWVENVVCIGLSAGFVEPLEATGLNWIISSATVLAQSLSAHYFDADTSAKYNANILGYIFDIQDFIDAHYKLSARRDSAFWRYQSSRQYPERLELRLALYAEEMPNDANRLKTSPWAFNEVSWLDILNGYEFRYETLQVHAMQTDMARKSLAENSRRRNVAIEPLSCTLSPRGECRLPFNG